MLRKPQWTNLLGMRWSRCDLDWVWLAVSASVWIKTKGSTRSVAACQPNQELEASCKCQIAWEEKCQNAACHKFGLWSIHSVKGRKVLSSSHYVLLKCTYSTLALVHPMSQENKHSMEEISNNWSLISFNRVSLESKTCIKNTYAHQQSKVTV